MLNIPKVLVCCSLRDLAKRLALYPRSFAARLIFDSTAGEQRLAALPERTSETSETDTPVALATSANVACFMSVPFLVKRLTELLRN
jgi:hypothetical protein